MKKQKLTIVIGLIIAVAMIFVTKASALNPLEESKVKELLGNYERVLNASDVEGILKLYAQDGVFMPQHSSSQVGTDAIREAYTHVFEAIDLDVVFDIIEVEIISDQWAFARTTSSGTTTINADGAKVPESNQELFLLGKQTNGEWKIARYIFSTMNPRQ